MPAFSYGATLDAQHIRNFRAKWPCHGLPDNLGTLHFQFSSSGDLVDVVARYRNGRRMDHESFDGPALVALCEDAQRQIHPEHADERYGKRD